MIFFFNSRLQHRQKLSKGHLYREKDLYRDKGIYRERDFLTQFFRDKIYFDDFQEYPADCPVASLAWPPTGLCIEKDLKSSPRSKNHVQNQKVRDQGLEQQNSLVNQYMTVEISCKLFRNTFTCLVGLDPVSISFYNEPITIIRI